MLRGLILDYYGVLPDLGEFPGAGNGRPPEALPAAPGEPPLVGAVVTARRNGLRTALMSNADSLAAGAREHAPLFDAILLSGQLGVGKPDPRIYLLAAERLGLIPEECVFVDDLRVNVHAAVQIGMVGVHHTDVRTTLDELAALFGFPLD